MFDTVQEVLYELTHSVLSWPVPTSIALVNSSFLVVVSLPEDFSTSRP